MTDWEALTDAERDALNEEAYGDCCDALRRADAEFPGCELAELRRYVAEGLQSDAAEYRRIIKRAKRTRATRLDKRSAESARQSLAWIDHKLGFIFDAEF